MSGAAPVRDWDAATYDRVSDIQLGWGLEVLERLPLRGHETVLDAGCGTGRVTRALMERLPDGEVVAVDASPSMVERAREALGRRARVHVADLSELELDRPVDAVFSTAVFHWIPDHERLFERLYAALRPGGRLVAQCGGEGNLERFHAVLGEVVAEPPFDAHFTGWHGPWNFPSPADTEARLRSAGFEQVACTLQRRDVRPEQSRAFVRAVNLGAHLERLPAELHERFVDAVLARVPEPLTLDYVRLDIDARRPA